VVRLNSNKRNRFRNRRAQGNLRWKTETHLAIPTTTAIINLYERILLLPVLYAAYRGAGNLLNPLKNQVPSPAVQLQLTRVLHFAAEICGPKVISKS
jgi:hypothetical protein